MDELKPVSSSQPPRAVLLPIEGNSSQNNYARDEQEAGSEAGCDIAEAPVKGGREEIQRQDENEDPTLVDWDGPDDPAKPVNWSLTLKWTNCVIISIYTFIT